MLRRQRVLVSLNNVNFLPYQCILRVNTFQNLYFSSHRIRFRTLEINIGGIALGGLNPIRIQSMTNTDTNDIGATVAQAIQLADAGCEYVRITAQGEREARNLALVRKELRAKGYSTPLIADIHFNPRAAEIAAGIVEKVRINPGNYVDKKAGHPFEFTDKEYVLELERMAECIQPLLSICKQNGTAIRIGSNHGSLSNRIKNRYGDTPEGMVESAMEFARICSSSGFHNLVLSMKSSNVRVMVQASRLLVHRMMQENMDFPLHLGVTEAGDGEDGIIKSAAGIGALLEDGIGDTIRVSLTGDPLKEIPVAKAIAERYNSGNQQNELPGSGQTGKPGIIDPFSYCKRKSIAVGSIGGHNLVQVLSHTDGLTSISDENNSLTGVVSEQELINMTVIDGNPKQMRLSALQLMEKRDSSPIILKNTYTGTDLLHFQVNSAIDFGALLIDGIGEAILPITPAIEPAIINRAAFSILQATRTRITRTEFISCPSCGRTLFDIENTLNQVREKTGHLKGLKIAVMGCIVNGPGEMADADYGYVGARKGKITLYKGKEVVRKNIPEADALEELLELIRISGDWKETIQ